mgnify:CR=1 FL=1
MKTLSVNLISYNEIDFISKWYDCVQQYADDIIVCDTGSTDGTLEFLLDNKIKVLQCSQYDLLEKGFSYIRNITKSNTNTDYIHYLDCDEYVDEYFRKNIHNILKDIEGTDIQSLRIKTRTYKNNNNEQSDYNSIISNCESYDMNHVRIHKNIDQIKWGGYIHEEIFFNEQNIATTKQHKQIDTLIHHHFTEFRKQKLNDTKILKYEYMMLNAYHNKSLQKYTNKWWYEVHVKERMDNSLQNLLTLRNKLYDN